VRRTQRGQDPQPLIAVRGAGGRIAVKSFASDWHEAHWIAGEVAAAIAAGTPGPEIVVLARTSYATQPVPAALARAGIPHRVLSSLGLFEQPRDGSPTAEKRRDAERVLEDLRSLCRAAQSFEVHRDAPGSAPVRTRA
jgi:hypothetical protein